MDKRLAILKRATQTGGLDAIKRYIAALERSVPFIEPMPDYQKLGPDTCVIRTIYGTELRMAAYPHPCDRVWITIAETGSFGEGWHRMQPGNWFWVVANMTEETMTAIINGLKRLGFPDDADTIYLRELKQLADEEQHLEECHARRNTVRDFTLMYIEALERLMEDGVALPPEIRDPEYPNEVIVRAVNNREIRTDGHTPGADNSSYVRITDFKGNQIAYWIIDEWLWAEELVGNVEEQEEVVGAIFGAFGSGPRNF